MNTSILLIVEHIIVNSLLNNVRYVLFFWRVRGVWLSFIFQRSTQVSNVYSVLTALERSLAMIEFDLQRGVLWVNSSFAQVMGLYRSQNARYMTQHSLRMI